jgi:Ni,Fe-hydrogenase III large subunit
MSEAPRKLTVRNGEARSIDEVANLEWQQFRRAILDEVATGAHVSAMFGHAPETKDVVEIFAVLTDRESGQIRVLKTSISGDSFPSLTSDCPQVQLFEREIAEQYELHPEGHPWLKPVRFAKSLRSNHKKPAESSNKQPLVGVTDFYRIGGEEIHEVAVGPVHAGVIEPGHFRFQCHGEEVFHLEISLGYQHRGVERKLIGGPDKRTIHYMETLAGDTTAGHTTAYCQSIEALAGCKVPARAQALRGVALELERMACHIGDLGALSGDVGFLPTASYCGRLRGDLLNMIALICGSRLGRALVRPGGVAFDLDQARAREILIRLENAMRDVTSAVDLLWNSSSTMSRFEETGKLLPETCEQLGMVGPAARACGLERDVRNDFPAGIFRVAHIPVSTAITGDVFARAYVRWLEIQRSADFVREQLQALVGETTKAAIGEMAGDKFVVSLVEGWRGQICHVVITDHRGRIARYKIVDPSFYNWMGLALAMRNQQISDFPLCNKSFNLSYCGHDL